MVIRPKVIDSIAAFVAKNGRIVVVARGRVDRIGSPGRIKTRLFLPDPMSLCKESAKVREVGESILRNYIVVVPRPFGKPQNGRCRRFQPTANNVFVSCRAIRLSDREYPAYDRNATSRNIALLLSIPY